MSFGALHVARTGLDAQGFRMQVIANNLANVNTTGFKRDRASFETLSYQMMTAPGAPSAADNRYATGLNLGTGVALSGTARIDTQGNFSTTGNGLDVAIDGPGYFQVEMPDGRIGYTRAGNFGRAPDGTIVTSDGKPVQPQIQVPEDATGVTIGADGTVSASVPGQADVVELGRLELARFANPAGLQAVGNNLLVETAASGAPQVGAAGEEGRGFLRGGMLEGSNVNVVEELVDMIETQRAYEVNSKMISATDEMMKNAAQTM
ncbi:flagellar basal-body rod protein FlgG [Sphingopyxis sp. XHP0097]|jgi:flagellar basal-body rod protein FlgG|uniref:Flagellar basal-body rod protein FlgG n=1 Tax=Sphingopyxis jiangsuensis TaxID=2871171 RepID=A0ABS7ME09_9SPHN|nr:MULTISPECIES: flagellar basal-body rod protein FlgG [Sphingopyxis]MBL0769615.1 flagellar basal-body rod protein FlgG [Sphingopyxis lutea]MBY4637256.1 flagellar basal-body rod protein FlgG [Sphingopyxis jiangsuensis]